MPATDPQVSDALSLPDVPVQSRPPTDSSRVLLGLIELSRKAGVEAGDSLEGIISPTALRRLLSTLHFRDVGTVLHSRRVARLAVGIAEFMQWEGRSLRLLELAALLHDIGKIGVPDNVLFKPGKLNPDEAELMSLHHKVAVDVLQACRVDREVLQIVAQSRDFVHEMSQTPSVNSPAVHMGARILSVADAYDSLRTEQVYRRAKSHEDALAVLAEGAGGRFDTNVVSTLARWTVACNLADSSDYQADNRPAAIGPAFDEPAEAQEADNLCRIFSYLYLLENLYDGFYLVDSDLKFVVWNGGLQKLLGHSDDELLQRPWSSRLLQYADGRGRELSEGELPMRQAVESGRAAAGAVRVRNAEGRVVDVEVQTVPLVDDWGRLRGVAEIFRSASRNRLPPREFRDLRLAASRDPLTGVANRGELEAQLKQLLSESVGEQPTAPCSAIFLDVDHFKEINDTFGHAVGDIVLIEIARLLQQETYAGEFVGRYGGEEFLVLCPATDIDQAIPRAERMRLAIAGLELSELEQWPLTASFGVTQALPGDTTGAMMRRADKALYAAKNGGRNQTCFLLENDPQAVVEEEPELLPPPGLHEFTASFHACTAAEMIVYKLGGFVTEGDAKLLEISPERVRLRLGRLGLLSGWGKTDERRPVEIELDFSAQAPPREVNGKLVKSNQVLVQIKIRPQGRPRSPEEFEVRARGVLKQLSTYFLAEV
ncbi:MAG: diguanylate cyclase [Planctomycetaceae bacterium]